MCCCDQATTAVPQIQGGTVKAYAVTSAQRLVSLQDVPSNKEAGLPGLEVTIWNGAYAPKGTPKEVIDLERRDRQVRHDAENHRALRGDWHCAVPAEMRSPAAHAKFLTEQFEFYAKMFAAANVKKEEAK